MAGTWTNICSSNRTDRLQGTANNYTTACVPAAQSCPPLCNPWTVACQAPLSVGFPRHKYWSGLPCPSPRDLPDPGIEPGSPALKANSLLSEPPQKQWRQIMDKKIQKTPKTRPLLLMSWEQKQGAAHAPRLNFSYFFLLFCSVAPRNLKSH